MWRYIKNKWVFYWENDEDNEDKKHLSQSDIRKLLYGGFMISVCTIIVCLFTISFCNIRVSRQNEKDTEKIIDMVSAYMATATDDEYEKIAQSIRNDLVFSEYGQEIESLINYIPNTADSCCLERESYLERINIVFLNTGEIYGLDIYEEEGTIKDEQESTGMRYSFGYDEISETSLHVQKCLSEKNGTATIYRKRRIVSAQKIKDHFCDNCIHDILSTTENELINEAVICDIEEKKFYPISEGELKIGNYNLLTTYEEGNFVIKIELQ